MVRGNARVDMKIDDQSKITGCKRILCISILVCGMFFNGIVYGLPSPSILSFQKDLQNTTELDHLFPNDLKLDSEQINLFASVANVGFPIGGLMCGVCVSFIGKRYSSIFGLGGSFMIGHLLITFAQNVVMLCAGRIISGICQGFCNCLVFIHCINFCNTLKEQTIVGIIMSLVGNSGTFYIYAFGLFLNWRQLAMVASLSAIPYVLGMIFVLPDDFPYHKYSNNRRLHKKFENQLTEDSDEFSTRNISMIDNVKALICNMNLLICIGMMGFYQFAGYGLIVGFAGKILHHSSGSKDHNITTDVTSEVADAFDPKLFQDSHDNSGTFNLQTVDSMSSLDPAQFADLAVAAAGIFGVIIGVILVNCNINRKYLLFSSAFGTVLSFGALGLYQTFGSSNSTVVPTICLTAFLTIFNMGYGPLCYCMMAELFPEESKHKFMSILMVFGGLFGFLNLKSLYLFETVLQLNQGPMFIIYASINAIGLLYLIFALPKDKVESMEFSPLSEVWYPALLSMRMTTIVAINLSTQDPAKAEAISRRRQSDNYLRRKSLKLGLEFHRSCSSPD